MVEFIKYTGFDHVFWYTGPWLWWLIGLYLCLPLLAYIVFPYFASKGVYSGKRRTISIFVLGDLGHSPRMCYHARSFSKLEYFVNLCGYLETQPPLEIIDDINVDISPISVVKNSQNLPYILFAIKKVAYQFIQIMQLLLRFRGSDFIMIQNPPSVPILLIVILFIKIFSRNSKLIVDWHNLNYTILNLRFKNLNHPLVRLVKTYEKVLGKFADFHITVTKSMKKFLRDEFGFKGSPITVLYDRPGPQFKPITELDISRSEILKNHDIFDGIENIGEYKILMSSTSFTPDEDFNVLLGALKKYDLTPKLPPILLIVTGKGPLKDQFLSRVTELKFSNKVIIKSAWLSSEDYPLILSTADLGVSLHTSSSGIDLPMKIVDFFGCGVPVVSLDFPSIDELVKEGVNGLITQKADDSSIQHTEEIYRLLVQAFTDDHLLQKLRDGAILESNLRWDENWANTLNSRFSYDFK
ncbi:beta-mannosyltransferase [Scheffersomyces xylosifermentans]|uniref:beta-mannosyltransferase n=1 Tax=Scheffersomyces xylosifermentans TaxID=1304137 RepID=UPI00315C8234